MFLQTIVYLVFFLTSIYAQPEPISCPPLLTKSSCNRIFVPLNHANPETNVRIPINYALLNPSTPVQSDTAFVIIPGGPGSSGITGVNDTALIASADLIQRPFLLFDPRGTGETTRLICTLSVNPLASATNISIVERLTRIRNCLSQIGPEIIHYSSSAIVEDLEIIRKTLGFKQFDLFGVSYGTYIAQLYALNYPNSIRSMIFDSPLPLDYNIYEPRDPIAFRRIYETQNAGNPDFNFTRMMQQTETVLNRLRSSEQLRRQLSIFPTDLYMLYSMAMLNLYPAAIASAAIDSNYTGLRQIQQLQPLNVQLPIADFNLFATVSIFCNDFANRVPWRLGAGFPKRIFSLTEDVVLNVDPKPFAPFTVIEGLSLVSFCTAFPFPQLESEGVPAQLPSQTDIPAIVLIGELDDTTILEDIDLLDPVLRSKVAVIKGGRHVVFGRGNECVDKLVLEFATVGTVANLSACA